MKMKVAIIEDDREYLDSLKKVGQGWQIDFFSDSADFGKVSLKQYSVIIADQSLPTIKGRDLLKSVLSQLLYMKRLPVNLKNYVP